jgi:hypothetical protein
MTDHQVLGIVTSVSGTLMAADQVRGLDHALRSRGWRPVQGRIGQRWGSCQSIDLAAE